MNRRRNYFIKPRFQTNFFIKFVILLLVEAFIIAGLFMFASRGTLTTAYGSSGLVIQKTGLFFLLDFVAITCFAGIAVALAAVFIFMYLSHRIGGPLYKLEKVLKSASGGDLAQRMQLRKTDELYDIKDTMNLFLAELDLRISNVKREIKESLMVLENETEPENIRKVKEKLEQLVSSLEYFYTT